MSRQKQTPVKPWTAMQDFGKRNERNIRESIERVDREERKNQDINEQVRQLLGIDEREPRNDLVAAPRTTQQTKKPAAKIKPPPPPPPPPPPKTFYKSDVKAAEKKAAEKKAVNKIEKAFKDRKLRVDAIHELDKRRPDFDPDKYQQLLRENLKKANDSLSHYRTRVTNQKLTEEQKKSISKSKKIQISVPQLAKAKATGRPLGSRKKD